MALVLRETSLSYVNNVAAANLALPAGSLAGELCILFIAHGWEVTSVPSGWQTLNISNGPNVNGAVYVKTLEAADITAGSIAVTFAGAYYGILAAATLTNGAAIRASAFGRNSTGATSRTITTASAASVGDYALYFAMGRANQTVNTADGAALRTHSGANASGVLRGGLLAAAGVEGATFTFSSTPTGDFEAIVVVSETAVSSAAVIGSSAAEVLYGSTPGNVAIGSAALEVLYGLSPGNALIGSSALEVLYGLNPGDARVGTIAIEVLRSIADAPPALGIGRRMSLM